MKVLFLIWVCIIPCFQCIYSNYTDYKLTAYIYEPEKQEGCNKTFQELYQLYSHSHLCFGVWEHVDKNKDNECMSYAYKNLAFDRDEMGISLQSFTYQYCNGTSDYDSCFKCFNDAMSPLWHRNYCNEYANWGGVTKCVKEHVNDNFQWSRDVILKNTSKEVNISLHADPYGQCREYFEEQLEIYDDFTVEFPVYLHNFRQEEREELNVMLSLFLNAFELNNPNGSYLDYEGFTCEEFVSGGYLELYHSRVIDPVTNPNDNKTVKAIQGVRADMCNTSVSASECTRCFEEGDKLFLPHLKNQNSDISSAIEEFKTINGIYENCSKQHNISKEYTDILKEPHVGMDKIDTSACVRPYSIYYDEMKTNPSLLSTKNMTRKAKVVINAVLFYVFSHVGYGTRHQTEGECPMYDFNRISRWARYSMKTIGRLSHSITDQEADNALESYLEALVYVSDISI